MRNGDDENRRDLMEAFRLMQVGDPPLLWDSRSMHVDTRALRSLANRLGWRIRIGCKPPLRACYEADLAGRLHIERLL